MSEEKLHDGVELLLKRMESHPEEFRGVTDMNESQYTLSTSRWNSVIHQYWRYLTEREQAAVKLGLRNAQRSNFHATVMETILGDKKEAGGGVNMLDAYHYTQGKQSPPQGLYNQLEAARAGQMTLPGIPTPLEYAISNTPIVIKDSTS